MKFHGICSALIMSFFFWAPVQSQAVPPSSPRLGARLGDFSYAMGRPDTVCSLGSVCFKNGGVVVLDVEGAVSDITLYWDEQTAPSSVDESRAMAQPFLPSDAVFQRTYSTKQGSTIDVYVSMTLAKAIPAKQVLHKVDGSTAGFIRTWGNDRPGTFIVLHNPRRKTGLYVGNNP